MKILRCEMCGSTELVKQDGVFVCQACNTKYSVEDAKKMMVEGTVEIAGPVKIDNTEEIENILQSARRAMDNELYDSAKKYYEQIMMKDASNWEAPFFLALCSAINCKNGEILDYAVVIEKNAKQSLRLIKDKGLEEEKEREAVSLICSKARATLTSLNRAFRAFVQSLSSSSTMDVIGKTVKEKNGRAVIASAMQQIGDCVIDTFGDKYSQIAIRLWKSAMPISTVNLDIYDKKIDSFLPAEEKERKIQEAKEKKSKVNKRAFIVILLVSIAWVVFVCIMISSGA